MICLHISIQCIRNYNLEDMPYNTPHGISAPESIPYNTPHGISAPEGIRYYKVFFLLS